MHVCMYECMDVHYVSLCWCKLYICLHKILQQQIEQQDTNVTFVCRVLNLVTMVASTTLFSPPLRLALPPLVPMAWLKYYALYIQHTHLITSHITSYFKYHLLKLIIQERHLRIFSLGLLGHLYVHVSIYYICMLVCIYIFVCIYEMLLL